MGIEIERRFLVQASDLDASILDGRSSQVLEQGYFTDEQYIRIRLINGREAKITRKSGRGIVREEDEMDLDPASAKMLLHGCSFRLRKRRFEVDKLVVDLLDPPLDHLVIVEREFSPGESTEVRQPAWVRAWTEVTDTLTNLHLARASRELEHHGNLAWVQFGESRLPQIVLTGGPCSGKSTLCERLRGADRERLQIVPEVATFLIGSASLPPPQPGQNPYAFNRALYAIQLHLEEASQAEATLQGKRAVITDRGTVDAAAYLPKGVADLHHIGRRPIADEYARYALVLCLAVPPRGIYDKFRAGNPARSEAYEQAIDVEDRLFKVWREHPNFHFIDKPWDEKTATVLRHIEEVIAASRPRLSVGGLFFLILPRMDYCAKM